ncbi:MAG: hypothetical protein U1E65_06680 [Myxococcota bacterium]
MASTFVFKDYRGLVQLRLGSADDLEHVHDLDPARWSSTSVPVDQLLCDPKFLANIDADKNGRVRVREVQAAHSWAKSLLKNRARLVERTDTITLADLDASNADAARLKALAEQRIKGSGSISLAQIREFHASYAKKFPNGDGVVTPAQVTDADLSAFTATVAKSHSAPDLSGDAGVDAAQLEAFLAHARSILAWEAEGSAAGAASSIRPLGDQTEAASNLVESLAPKLDQFYAQCDFLGQEKAAVDRLTETAESLKAIDTKDPAAIRAYLKEASIGRLNVEASLDLTGWLNPLFQDDVKRLASEVLPKVLGLPAAPRALSRADWNKVRGAFEAYRAWQQKKPAPLPDGLAGDPLRALVEGPHPAALTALAAEDKKASEELQAISDLEKLALYQRWLIELMNNMVSFPALFQGKERCLFEVGTLVLDGREMNLCVRVNDVGAHKAIADESNVFVIYVECERRNGDALEKMVIGAGVTSGTRRGIAVGKRGVFYDRDGREWDARVIDLIVKPISLMESAVAPFVRLRAMIADRIQKLVGNKLGALEKSAAESADAKVTATGTAALEGAPAAAPAAAPPPPPPAPAAAPGAGLQGLLVGGSIAFAALGSAMALIVQTVANIAPLKGLLAVAGVVVAIMGLSAFLGWLKLRKRDVSTLLEACGWAFNVRIYLRRALSLRFTRVPPLPSGSVRERTYIPLVAAEEEPSSLRWVLPLLVLAAIGVGVYLYWEPLLAMIQR